MMAEMQSYPKTNINMTDTPPSSFPTRINGSTSSPILIQGTTFGFQELHIGVPSLDFGAVLLPDVTCFVAKQSPVALLGVIGGSKWDTLVKRLMPESGFGFHELHVNVTSFDFGGVLLSDTTFPDAKQSDIVPGNESGISQHDYKLVGVPLPYNTLTVTTKFVDALLGDFRQPTNIGISPESLHMRQANIGNKKDWRKKRKPVTRIRAIGGNVKWKAFTARNTVSVTLQVSPLQLSPSSFGPCHVARRIQAVANTINIPPNSRRPQTFHGFCFHQSHHAPPVPSLPLQGAQTQDEPAWIPRISTPRDGDTGEDGNVIKTWNPFLLPHLVPVNLGAPGMQTLPPISYFLSLEDKAVVAVVGDDTISYHMALIKSCASSYIVRSSGVCYFSVRSNV